MKRAAWFFPAVLLLLVMMFSGCGSPPEPEPAVTVRLTDRSGMNWYELAVRYSVQGKVLGSMACQPLGRGGDGVYDFVFPSDLLPEELPEELELSFFAAEEPSEDYTALGEAVLYGPEMGDVFSLILEGGPDGFVLTPETENGKILPSGE